MNTCERASCDRPVKAQGMCDRHYQRERHRHRQPTPARILRRRGRQRAMAALVQRHKDEFKELLDYCTEIVRQENEQLRGELDTTSDVVFLRPGPKPDDQEPVDRVTLDPTNSVRCVKCYAVHDKGHRCASCGADPTVNRMAARMPPVTQSVLRKSAADRTGERRFALPFMDGSELCAQTDPEAFFVDRGGNPEPAKKVCARCPLRVPCLDYAIRNPVMGVWGGTTEHEREQAARLQGLSYSVVRVSLYAGPQPGDRPDLDEASA